MSKGNSLNLMRGKLGNKVLFKVTNSNNKEKQGERVYRAIIGNPKTLAQLRQRIKLAPAVNFYRAFGQEVLDHSWQGVKYGGRSHSKFMSLVMKSDDGNYPYIVKGDTRVVPGSFPVSRGGLAGISVFPTGNTNGGLLSSLILSTSDDLSDISFKDAVEVIVRYNPFLQKGDQLTLLTLSKLSGTYVPRVQRIVLDESKYPGLEHITDIPDTFLTENGFEVTGFVPVACACIVSRPQVTRGSVVWARSNANMNVLSSELALWQSEQQFNLVLDSYRNSETSVNSDWYLNDGTTQITDGEASTRATAIVDIKSVGIQNYVKNIADFTTQSVAFVGYQGGEQFLVAEINGNNLNVFTYYPSQSAFGLLATYSAADRPVASVPLISMADANKILSSAQWTQVSGL